MTVAQQTLAEQFAAYRAAPNESATKPPAEVLAWLAEERARLAAAGVPAGVPLPGAPMPDGELLDVHGTPTSLADARAGGPAVVVTYRGAWCPFCNITLRVYEEQLVPSLDAKGVRLIAISPQKPDGSLTMQETNALTFTVLSDPGNQIATQLGALLPLRGAGAPAPVVARSAQIASGNADGTDRLPMPTVVVVDAAGTIRWIDVHPDHMARTEPREILEAVASTIG